MNDILVVVYLVILLFCFIFGCLTIEKKVKAQKTQKVKFAIKFAKIALFVLLSLQSLLIITVHFYFGGYWFLLPGIIFNLMTAKR